jgi:hypothetical protein
VVLLAAGEILRIRARGMSVATKDALGMRVRSALLATGA